MSGISTVAGTDEHCDKCANLATEQSIDSDALCSFRCAPILIIAFNRPDLLREQIRNIAAARPTQVFLAVDGARNPEEEKLCSETRAAVGTIDWPCEVKTYFRDENRGCRNAPPEAISWFFSEVESGIVLEDDCHPALSFIRFASELLERYKDDSRIGAITAFNRYNLQTDTLCSYHFSKEFNVWAWATWKRVWKDYDVTMMRYVDGIENTIARHTRNRRMRNFWSKSIAAVLDGTCNTWDTQFSVMFVTKGYLSVLPRERLASNVGIGIQVSTHTGGYDFYADEFSTCGHVDFPLIHPTEVIADKMADDRTERIVMGIIPRGLTFVGNKVPICIRSLITTFGKLLYRLLPRLFEL